MMPFLVGVDLGQARDFTAIAILEQVHGRNAPGTRPEDRYNLRYLERVALGTPYPVIVQHVLSLLRSAPLTLASPLVVDQTGVGRAIVDMFTAAGVRPRAVTITGGDAVTRENAYNVRVPKRDLVGTLLALYQQGSLRTAPGLPFFDDLVHELVNFQLKVNIATGNDSYEAWRESIHDDLVLAVALACWWGENPPPGPAPGLLLHGGVRPGWW